MDTIERIKNELAQVPTLPGVYLWKNADGEVIYVGKAKQLRARMRQYVNFQDDRAKIPLLVEQIASFDYIVAENEHESLVLEKNLIQQYTPYFNADFKDDKSYPFIALTKGDVFPAIKYTREKHRADTRYFGPYTDSRAAHALMDVARRVVPICAASCADWRRMNKRLKTEPYSQEVACANKECFDSHVGLGPGACCGKIYPQEYALLIKRIERFLAGSQKEFVEELQSEMTEAASTLEFERAARIKQQLDLITSVTDKQHAVSTRDLNADVIGIFREETVAGVQLLMVREGRVINAAEFILNKGLDVPDQDLLHNFLLRYYDATTSIPHEVIVSQLPEDLEVMEDWLTRRLASPHGAKVRFTAPERGEKNDLLRMAQTNAKHALNRYKVRTNYEDKRTNEALLQLESALAMDRAPLRIECYDISTIHGKHSVASMVVFTNGKPDKSQYRRFKIRMESDEANDFAMMSETLRRRFAPERMADTRFGSKPDLLVVDGGKPQLTAALNILEELGVDDLNVCGLAKRDEELFVPWSETGPVILPTGSASLYLIKRVRDESHRVAITFHRELRGKAMTKSILDEVPGIGPKRKKALYKAFSNFRSIREASVQELKDSKCLPDDVCEDLHAVLRQYNEDQSNGDADVTEDGGTVESARDVAEKE